MNKRASQAGSNARVLNYTWQSELEIMLTIIKFLLAVEFYFGVSGNELKAYNAAALQPSLPVRIHVS